MTRLASLALIVAITALSIASTAVAADPDGSSDSAAIWMDAGSASGNLIGNTSGSYRYFALNSPSRDSEVTVTLSFTPTDQPVANAIGVVAWQNGQQLGKMNGVGYTPGTTMFAFKPVAAGKVTVQVYSYYPAAPISFTLQASVSDRAVPTGVPQPQPTPAPLSARLPAEPSQPVGAVLPGNAYGSFHYYTYDYPGDGSIRTITLSVSPSGADTTNAVFLTVYQNGVVLAHRSAREVVVPGVLPLTYSSNKPGPVLVEVANYNYARTIVYALANAN